MDINQFLAKEPEFLPSDTEDKWHRNRIHCNNIALCREEDDLVSSKCISVSTKMSNFINSQLQNYIKKFENRKDYSVNVLPENNSRHKPNRYNSKISSKSWIQKKVSHKDTKTNFSKSEKLYNIKTQNNKRHKKQVPIVSKQNQIKNLTTNRICSPKIKTLNNSETLDNISADLTPKTVYNECFDVKATLSRSAESNKPTEMRKNKQKKNCQPPLRKQNLPKGAIIREKKNTKTKRNKSLEIHEFSDKNSGICKSGQKPIKRTKNQNCYEDLPKMCTPRTSYTPDEYSAITTPQLSYKYASSQPNDVTDADCMTAAEKERRNIVVLEKIAATITARVQRVNAERVQEILRKKKSSLLKIQKRKQNDSCYNNVNSTVWKNKHTEKYNHDEKKTNLSMLQCRKRRSPYGSREKSLSHSGRNFEKSTYNKRSFKKQKLATEYYARCRKVIKRKRSRTSLQESNIKKRCIEAFSLQKSEACRTYDKRSFKKQKLYSTEFYEGCRKIIERKRSRTSLIESSIKKRCIEEINKGTLKTTLLSLLQQGK